MFLSDLDELLEVLEACSLKTLVYGRYEIINIHFILAEERMYLVLIEKASALRLWCYEPEEEDGAEPGVEGDPGWEVSIVYYFGMII